MAWSVHDDVHAQPAAAGDPADPRPVHELVRTLGCSAWIVTGGGLRPQRLCRIGRERVDARPVPSSIDWTIGKGIIGKCWETGQEQVVDTSVFDREHSAVTRSQWDALDVATRRALSYDEYHRIRFKYGTVIAMPLLRQEKVVGVVALDAPPGVHHRVDHPVIINTVGATAELIMNILT